MATTSFSPQGSEFEIEDPIDSGTYHIIGSLRNLTREERQVDDQNTTSHDSENREKEYRPGLKEPGRWRAELFTDYTHANAAVQALVENKFDAREVDRYRIQVRDETGVTIAYRVGKGYVKVLGETYPSDGTMSMRPIEIKATGPWPLTIGTP